jgi:hypothetical protein
MWQGGKWLRFVFGPPEGRPTKTNLHEAVVCSRVVPLAFSIWKVHNNPGAAIPPCANKPDNMEPYGRIPMLTHASHGTGAPAIGCKIAKRPRPGKQKLSPRNQPLRKVTQGKQLPLCHTPHQLFPNLVHKVPDHVPSNSFCACTCLSSDSKCDKAEKDWGSCLAHLKVGLLKPTCTKQWYVPGWCP